MSRLEPFRFAKIVPRSAVWSVRVNGEPVEVLDGGPSDFASFGLDGPIDVECIYEKPISEAFVRPLSRGVDVEVVGRTVRFQLDGPQNVYVDATGQRELFLFGSPVERPKPGPADPNTIVFPGGQVFEIGEFEVSPGQRLYLEGGAFVRGRIHGLHADGVTIDGPGVLDASWTRDATGRGKRAVLLEGCQDVTVKDLTVIKSRPWTVVFGACQDVRVQGIRQVCESNGSDGIDVCGSQDVLIEGCFLRNGDDCLVIKAFGEVGGEKSIPWDKPVRNVVARDCALHNNGGGSAMEIGYELRTEVVEDVLFEDIDVMRVNGYGAVFSIKLGDRANVRNVTYRNVRVEHCYDKLIDFRVIDSRWNRDAEKGTIEGVTLENISWNRSMFNDGYTTSILSGYSAAQPIKDVTIRNFVLDGQVVTDLDELDIHARHAEGVELVHDEEGQR